MVLKFHQQSDSYFLISEDAEKAQKAGLTQSTKRKGPNGESVWYTADYQKNPVDNPYAALPFFSEAEGEAVDRLRSLQDDYELSWATDSDTDYPCPDGLSFLPYQKAGIHYAVEKGNVLIGDEMGLGKTPQSIGVANAIGAKKVLVLCPASIRLNWRREIKKWSTIPRVKVDAVLKASAGVHPCAHYVVCSYDLARNLDIHEVLCETDWDLLIIDEAHYLKSSDAQRTRAVFGGGMKAPFKNRHISDKAGKIVALTGTPLPNRPRECFDGSVEVLTDRGWVRIIDVELTDKLWDGEEWVKHDGLLYQGKAKTRNLEGIIVTDSHLFRAKSSWVSAEEASLNTDILNQILEKGSENLPLSATDGVPAEQLQNWCYSATADQKSSKQHQLGCTPVDPVNADLAEQSKAGPGEKHTKELTTIYAQTRKSEPSYEQRCQELSKGAQTLTTPRIKTTEVGESHSTNLGKKTGSQPCCTSSLSTGTINLTQSWTESTMIEDTNPEICDSSLEKRTHKTGEQCLLSKTKSENWNPELNPMRDVYDIANAGPRQRFTVLSDKGPMIAHNCYTISRGLCWDAIDWASYDDFCFRHNPSARVGSGGAVREEKGRLLELQARLRCNFMIRRLKKDVLKDLPDKRYEMSYVETNGKIQQVLQKERLLDFDPDEVSNPDFFLDGAISTVRREMGEAKVPRIVEHMKYLLDIAEVEKVVMFSHHRSVMDALHEALDKYGVAVVRGGMSAVAKQEEVDKFVNDPKCRIFSGQLDAASTGIDGLQKVASHVVLAEPAWNPGINEQAIDRCHRFGQHGNVIAQFLVVEGSLDEKVLSSVVGKAHTVHEALDLN